MPDFLPGLVHTPVTPFTADGRIDLDRYGEVLDFHRRNGADALALPMHAGESVSLSEDEKRELLAFALKRLDGALPVMAHVSNAGTAIAAAFASDAQTAGAAAIVAAPPYYWTPPAPMLLAHFVEIARAVEIPFFVYNSPDEMPGVKLTADLALKLIDAAQNFAGVIDLGLDWQFMIELMTYAPARRPGFQLLAGTEHLVSAGAIGATGMLSPLAALAPRLVRDLFERCRDQKFFEARPAQEALAALRQITKDGGVASLKAALRSMGRDCGAPRRPLLPLDAGAEQALADGLAELAALQDEPRGW
jgi:4-hydroxy-tetrahydrodipicolinate synthase